MSSAEKTARSMLKEANELGNTLRDIVRRDLACLLYTSPSPRDS